MNGSNNCNFQAVSTNCFDSIKIANNSNHSVDLNIDESGNQEAILLCPSENIVETSIIQTSNNSIEVQIFDTQTYHDANTLAETNKGNGFGNLKMQGKKVKKKKYKPGMIFFIYLAVTVP